MVNKLTIRSAFYFEIWYSMPWTIINLENFFLEKNIYQRKNPNVLTLKLNIFLNLYTELCILKRLKNGCHHLAFLFVFFFPFLPSDCQRCKRNSARVCVRVHQLHHQRVSFLKTAYFWRGGGHFDNPCFLLNSHFQHAISFLLILWNLMLKFPLKKN